MKATNSLVSAGIIGLLHIELLVMDFLVYISAAAALAHYPFLAHQQMI